jgi:hypothetical protein
MTFSTHLECRPPTRRAASTWIVDLVRSVILDASCGNGFGTIRADRFDHPSFSLLAPVLGPQQAALAMGLATASAIAGRTVVGWVMPLDADRRVVASANYAVQIAGSIAFIVAARTSAPLLLLGMYCLAPVSAMRHRCRR